jgi:hypothetical protein
MPEGTRQEHGDGDVVRAAPRRDRDVARHRHLGDIELLIPQSPPENLLRLAGKRLDADARELDRAIEDRPRAIGRHARECQIELCHDSVLSFRRPRPGRQRM